MSIVEPADRIPFPIKYLEDVTYPWYRSSPAERAAVFGECLPVNSRALRDFPAL